MKVIAITGGIGSGKSVVSAVLRTMGYPVYDCDSRAKFLMDTSLDIKNSLVAEFGAHAVDSDGIIDRNYLSEVVFGDAEALKCLNGIVHPVVRHDLLRWVEICGEQGNRCAFVETAILRQSNLCDLVSAEWIVVAPVEVRIERVMKRNQLPRQAVEARIASQTCGAVLENTATIHNNNQSSIIFQIEQLLQSL